jgi:hypothetical protein
MIRLSALRKIVHFRDTNARFRALKGLGGGGPPSKSVSWILGVKRGQKQEKRPHGQPSFSYTQNDTKTVSFLRFWAAFAFFNLF